MDRAVTNEAETNEAVANHVAAKQALANEALANEAALPEIVAPRSDAPSEPLALRLLDPSEVRARRRPVALGLYVAYQMATGLLVALPVHAWAKAVWGAHPDGDAVLFRPGARDLLAWIGGTSVTLDVVGRTTLALGALIVLMHPLPLGLLLAALATGRDVLGIAPRPRALVRAAAPMFAPLLLVFVIASLAQLCVLGLGFAAGGFFESSLTTWIGERPALLARVAMLLPFVFAASVFGVEADVARAYVARTAIAQPARPSWDNARAAIVAAVRLGRRDLASAYVAWVWRAALGVAFVGLGALASNALGGKGGVALAALFAAHRLVVAGRAALRASWLAEALRRAATSR